MKKHNIDGVLLNKARLNPVTGRSQRTEVTAAVRELEKALLAAGDALDYLDAAQICALVDATLQAHLTSTQYEDPTEFVKSLFKARLALKQHEFIEAMFFDAGQSFLGVQTLAEGDAVSATLHPRDLLRRGIEIGAYYIVIAHNHPSCAASPSAKDVEMHRLIYTSAGITGFEVLDHLIIAGDDVYSFAENGILIPQ